MKTLIKGDPVTAAARTEVGIIPTFLIFSLGFMAGLVLFVMLRTDWSVVMPYYHADGPEQIAVFDNSRGKTAPMEIRVVELVVTVTVSPKVSSSPASISAVFPRLLSNTAICSGPSA